MDDFPWDFFKNKNFSLVPSGIGGGEGKLFYIKYTNGKVEQKYIAKIYNNIEIAEKKEKKVEALIKLFRYVLRSPETNLVDKSRYKCIFDRLGMPLLKIRKYNQFIGFIMTYHKYTSSLEKYIDKYRKSRHPKKWLFQMDILISLADILSALHDLGIVVGDLNLKNILIKRVAPEEKTRDKCINRHSTYISILIDCDSVQFNGFKMDAINPSIAPPEVFLKNYEFLPPTSDSYIFANIVYRVLMGGFSPFQYRSNNPNDDLIKIMKKGKTPLRDPSLKTPIAAPPISILGTELREILADALDPNPDNRPTVSDIKYVLQNYLKRKTQCKNGHYTPPLRRCIVCGAPLKRRSRYRRMSE